MPSWTPEDLRAYELRKTQLANKHQIAKPELPLPSEPLRAPQDQARDAVRFLVCIESRRRKLLDPDNLCAKYVLDCCRYAGLIPDDRPQDIEFKCFQTQVETEEEECTIVTIEPT